jgi:hypothetical protein
MTVPLSHAAQLWRGGAASLLGLAALLAEPCYAAHWQVIGRPSDQALALAYIDMDSIHRDGDYRVATYLTVYVNPITNAHGYKLDRIAQDTAFDCNKHTFALVATFGYFEGKPAGRSSGKPDEWKDNVRDLPKDPFSQRAFDVICNAPLAPMPEPTPSAEDAAATVRLPSSPPTSE